jgi:beta-glucosidase
MSHSFPPGFLWGVSTSSYQVEGGIANSQWSDWEANGGIRDGSRSGLACDWWNNAEGDFDLAAQMGLNAIRLSIEWSRVEPVEGRWDTQAVARYRQMLLGLHARGIRPMVCLHHFTIPRWLEARGGFLAPDAISAFAAFTRRIVEELRDLCRDWITVNEPNVYAAFGYFVGEFPPGRKADLGSTLRVLCRLAQAHGMAYQIIHRWQPEARVGWAQNYVTFAPASGRRRDRLVSGIFDQLFNRTFFHVLKTGQLQAPWNRFGEEAREARDCCDFVGLNVYNRLHVTIDPRARDTMFARIFVPENAPQGDPGAEYPYGECYPQVVRHAVEAASDLGRPIYILENGVPDAQDRIRPWLLVNVLRELHRLIAEGYDIRGYFHWTLVDSFEWSEGWRLRFGLYHLDPATQRRTPRCSAGIYSRIARTGTIPDEFERYASLPYRDLITDEVLVNINEGLTSG